MNGILEIVVDSDSCSFTVIVTYFGFRLWFATSCCIVLIASPIFLTPSANLVGLAPGGHQVVVAKNLYSQQRARLPGVGG